MLRRQIAVYIAKNIDFFEPRMRTYLQRHHLSFTTYVKAFAHGHIWSDVFTIGAIVRMWNMPISIISPTLKDVWRIHHNVDQPDIVIIANGSQFASERAITYFIPTCLENKSKIVASNEAAQGNIEQLHGDTNGYKEGTKVLFIQESERLLKDHYFLANRLQKLRAKVGDCEKELDEIEKHMDLLGYDQGCFARFKRHMDKIMENAPQNVQKAMPKAQDGQMYRIPKINVKDIFGEVIISELTRKRKATEPHEMSRSKKVATDSSENYDAELTTASESEDVIFQREEQGNANVEKESTEETEDIRDKAVQEKKSRKEARKRVEKEVSETENQEADQSNEEQGSKETVEGPTNKDKQGNEE